MQMSTSANQILPHHKMDAPHFGQINTYSHHDTHHIPSPLAGSSPPYNILQPHTKMEIVSPTSNRSGLLLLRKIGQTLFTQVDTFASHMGLSTRSNEAPCAHVRTPSSESRQPQLGDGQHHQEEEEGPVLPLIRIPEDVRPNMLAFLTARELSSVRRVCRGFLQTADLHAEALWDGLCRRDFPSVERPTDILGRTRCLSAHQVRFSSLADRFRCGLRLFTLIMHL